MLPGCLALYVARWREKEMAAALSQGGNRWHALISMGAKRLSDSHTSFPTRDAAEAAAYQGLQIYVKLIENLSLPAMDSLVWTQQNDPDKWLEAFYAKPLFPGD